MDGMEIIRKWQKLCQPSTHQTGRGNMWHSDGDEDEAPRCASFTPVFATGVKLASAKSNK